MPGNEQWDHDPVEEAGEIPEGDLPVEESMIPPTRDSAWIIQDDGSGTPLPAGQIIHVHAGSLNPEKSGKKRKRGTPAGAGTGNR